MRILLSLAAYLTCTGVVALSPEALFARGNEAYANGQFEVAIEAYEGALESGHSVPLHVNLGHSYAETGRPGRAILHYEKALALDPGNAEARLYLDQLRDETGLPEPASGFLWPWATLFDVDTWAWLAMGSFWLGVLGVIWPRLRRNGTGPGRTLAVSLGTIGLAMALVGLTGYHLRGQEGVILTAEAALRVAPTPQSPSTGEAREGLRLTYVRQREGYFLVEGPNGETGWLTKEEFQPIWDPVGG